MPQVSGDLERVVTKGGAMIKVEAVVIRERVETSSTRSRPRPATSA